MSRVSFDDTPDSDGVAERVMLEDLEKAERRITQLEANINLFIKYVASIRFTTAERDSAPWMSNWEAGLLSGTLTEPVPYVEPEPDSDGEPEYEVIAEDDVGNLTELVGEAESLAAPADVADEDALADETAVDDSEPPLLAA
jgi:hypothetical protein